jgi:hypothetical protein
MDRLAELLDEIMVAMTLETADNSVSKAGAELKGHLYWRFSKPLETVGYSVLGDSTLSIKTFGITAQSIMKLSIMKLSIMTLSTMTLRIMTVSTTLK